MKFGDGSNKHTTPKLYYVPLNTSKPIKFNVQVLFGGETKKEKEIKINILNSGKNTKR